MSNIVSIDPGDRSGVVLYNSKTERFESFEMDDIEELLTFVDIITRDLPIDLVIIENFLILSETHKTKKPKRWPLETVGAVRWITYKNQVPLIIQTPAQKDWMTDKKLKQIGWYKGTSSKHDTEGHADDAARHLGVYLGVTLQDPDFLRKLI